MAGGTTSHIQPTIAEYVWIGGNLELRSKARTLYLTEISVETLPEWNFDGSSTKQASGEDSEVVLKPVSIYKCPFRAGNCILVMCQTFLPNGEPHLTNHYYEAKKMFDVKPAEHPWYGIEQEFFIIDSKTNKPVGFPENGFPSPQGQYYCSVGTGNAIGREIVEECYLRCLNAGIKISGINAEVAPGQWEYQVGPVEGIEAGNQLWMSRYILQRVSEKYNVKINFEPKPIKGAWNGSGCHTNFSTESMRKEGGIKYIESTIKEMEKNHTTDMLCYGTGNEERMTGEYETANYNKFTYGIADRGRSVRIGNETKRNGCGYFEDRRPSSNMDPYIVTCSLFGNFLRSF